MESIKDFLENNQYKIKHSIRFKFRNSIITLADQEEACKNSWYAYWFVELNITGTDFEKCQEAVCKSCRWAYRFARDISGADIEKCQEAACKESYYAYCFALNIQRANLEKCQEAACKDTKEAYWFAVDIPGADVEYCRKACENHEYFKNEFDKIFPRKEKQ